MSDDGLNLSRRKVLGGITTVGAASAAAGAGTFALFSDTGQTNKQTISTGTVRLNDNNPFVGNLSNEDLGSSGQIGTTDNPAYVRFEYEGTLEANIYLGMEITDPEGTVTANEKTATELAEQITLSEARIKIWDKDGNLDSTDSFTGADGESGGASIESGVTELDEEQFDTDDDGEFEETPTLADLASELPTTTDNNDNTVPDLNYATVSPGDKVELQIVGQLDVGDDFEGEALDIQVFGKVEEA